MIRPALQLTIGEPAAPPASFVEFMRQTVGANWVAARRSPRIVAKYGEDVVCLSAKRYAALEARYERETLRSAHGVGPCKALTDAAPRLLAALQTIAAIPDPATPDNRGPLRYARHIAKSVLAELDNA